jgi:hypothetical protein
LIGYRNNRLFNNSSPVLEFWKHILFFFSLDPTSFAEPFEPRHDKKKQHNGFATSMDPDQPAHPDFANPLCWFCHDAAHFFFGKYMYMLSHSNVCRFLPHSLTMAILLYATAMIT